MNIKPIVCAVLAITLGTGGTAFAQNYGDRNDHQQRDGQGDNRDNRDNRDNHGNHDNRGNQGYHGNQGWPQDHRDNRDNGQANRDRQGERGAGPNHEFYRGQRLPPEYRNRQYVVNDWRGHHLNAPPRGYQWVQTGGDYVLVAISTGIILQLLLGN